MNLVSLLRQLQVLISKTPNIYFQRINSLVPIACSGLSWPTMEIICQYNNFFFSVYTQCFADIKKCLNHLDIPVDLLMILTIEQDLTSPLPTSGHGCGSGGLISQSGFWSLLHMEHRIVPGVVKKKRVKLFRISFFRHSDICLFIQSRISFLK